MDMYEIRAHHLLCIQGFQGYGYSTKFTDNLSEIVTYLYSENPVVKITTIVDNICRACPHSKGDLCNKESCHSDRLDNLVLEKTGLKENVGIRLPVAFSRINEQLASPADVNDICGACDWQEKCVWFQSRVS